MEGARLEASNDGLLAMARQAMGRHTGARGLRAVLEELLLETMFDLPSHGDGARYIIDADAVVQGHPRRLPERTAA
jgi:ATP-dependent Clp protease ATP-binding subunit ClpX